MANDSGPNSKIIDSANGEFVSFVLNQSVFVSCFDANSGRARGGHFRVVDIGRELFVSRMKTLITAPKDSEVKIIGGEAGCRAVVEFIKKMGVNIYRTSYRQDGTQVLFYPATGRVRVENLSVSLATANSSPVATSSAVPKAPSAPIAVKAPGPVVPSGVPAVESKKALALNSKIRVLIVDDSKTIRILLQDILQRDPSIEIVGATGQPKEVLELVAKLKPDVITMDIHMPDIDGVTLVKELMFKIPTPTVMITSASIEDGPAVLTSLENGAVDYIQKPSFEEIERIVPVIIEKVKGAAFANIDRSATEVVIAKAPVGSMKMDVNTLVAIGSSTGGTEALKAVLTGLPREIPPIVIVQHIPPIFSDAFARRMATLCPFEVKEAQDDDLVKPGRVLIAPGGKQMAIKVRGDKTLVSISDDPPVNRHRPSVDYLFDSIATKYRGPVIGVILTGMGADGAKGLLALKKKGSYTIAQSEKTCVVFGMPREAIELGAAEDVLDLRHISGALIKRLSSKKAA